LILKKRAFSLSFQKEVIIMITAEHILNEIVSAYGLPEVYLDTKKYPLPNAYSPDDKSKIKAFVLGSDPSNFIGDSQTVKVNTVFGIGEEKQYFSSISKNLEILGLSINDIYVQNAVRNYCYRETRSNPYWDKFAEGWFPYLAEEFSAIDPGKKLPVFVTDERVMRFLLIDPFDLAMPAEYYNGLRFIPVLPEDNKLERNLIPLYRYPAFALSSQEFYKNRILDVISIIAAEEAA
jgi:hypothetical protein